MHGVDAPEKGQEYGAKSKAALGKLVFEKDATVAVTDVDRYKRLVGKVTVGGTDVNLKMVTDGWCRRYTQYDKKGEYRDAQAEAKENKWGLWVGSDPVPPWEIRGLKGQPQ
ncbi:MAG: thermonuclease family protein [Gemmataceae bacterium]|nr:thermonuclease family protein [Gemmataceae bacterium]